MFQPYKNLMEKENGRRKLFFWAHIGPPTVPKKLATQATFFGK